MSAPTDNAFISTDTYRSAEGFVQDYDRTHLLSICSRLQYKPELHCETDPQALELVVYCAVSRIGPEGKEVLVGNREPGAGEDRLHGNKFLGWGGHVERQDADTQPITSTVSNAAKRELDEELRIQPEGYVVQMGYVGTIYWPYDDVGQDHLGLVYDILVDGAEVRETEKYGEGEWCQIQQAWQLEHYEPWSRLLIPEL